jgi:hypothetical protein
MDYVLSVRRPGVVQKETRIACLPGLMVWTLKRRNPMRKLDESRTSGYCACAGCSNDQGCLIPKEWRRMNKAEEEFYEDHIREYRIFQPYLEGIYWAHQVSLLYQKDPVYWDKFGGWKACEDILNGVV